MRGPRPLPYSVDTLGDGGPLYLDNTYAWSTFRQHMTRRESAFAYVHLPALYRQYTTYAWSRSPWSRRMTITDMRGPRPLPSSVDTLGKRGGLAI